MPGHLFEYFGSSNLLGLFKRVVWGEAVLAEKDFVESAMGESPDEHILEERDFEKKFTEIATDLYSLYRAGHGRSGDQWSPEGDTGNWRPLVAATTVHQGISSVGSCSTKDVGKEEEFVLTEEEFEQNFIITARQLYLHYGPNVYSPDVSEGPGAPNEPDVPPSRDEYNFENSNLLI
jgi:hypothetical protein